MRLLDRYIGVPACFCLHVLDGLINFSGLRKDSANADSILVIKFWGIGSIILASPALKAIRDAFPGKKIIFLTMARNKGLYDKAGLFDQAYYFEVRKLGKIIPDFIRAVINLRREKIDLVVDLEPFCRFSTILSYASGAPKRISYDTKNQGRGWLYTDKIKFRDHEHMLKNFLSVLKPLNIHEYSEELIPIPYSELEEKKVDVLLIESGVLNDDVLVGLNVNSSDFAVERRWPNKNFAKLADHLIEKYGVKTVYIGLHVDHPLVDETINLMSEKKEAINLAGKTDLTQLACLMTKMKLFISNDSGPLHIAAAMKTPTASFYGPETPLLYGPWGENNTVFYKKNECSPCINIYNSKRISCHKNAQCIKGISVDEVTSKIKSLNLIK